MTRDQVAIHEAGHAVACAYLKIPIKKVSLRTKRSSLGTRWGYMDRGQRNYPAFRRRGDAFEPIDVDTILRRSRFDQTVVCLAGPVAEYIFSGRDGHADGDLEIVKGILELLDLSEQEGEKWCVKAQNKAIRLLLPRMDKVKRLADALLERGTIGGEAALRIIRRRSARGRL